jgi:hypothetical protein
MRNAYRKEKIFQYITWEIIESLFSLNFDSLNRVIYYSDEYSIIFPREVE